MEHYEAGNLRCGKLENGHARRLKPGSSGASKVGKMKDSDFAKYMVCSGGLKLGLCLAALYFGVSLVFGKIRERDPKQPIWSLAVRSLIYGEFVGLPLAWWTYKARDTQKNSETKS